MSTLTAANKARQSKSLNIRYNFTDYGVKSYLQLIEMGVFVRAQAGTKPSVRWNRIKYNRMDWSEQKEYERKLDTMIPDYRLYTSLTGTSFFSVPKTVYDYFISL